MGIVLMKMFPKLLENLPDPFSFSAHASVSGELRK